MARPARRATGAVARAERPPRVIGVQPGRQTTLANRRLDGLRGAIVVTDDFEQSELAEPRKALEQAGATAQIVAPHAGRVQGMQHDVKADTLPVNLTLDQAEPDEFDAVLLPGGVINADALRVERKAQDIVRAMDRAGKPIAVICHGPWLLVSVGLVRDRTLTSYHTIQDDIRNAGGNWQDREMVRDRNWVSSRSPKDLPAFPQAMVELFAEQRERAQPARAGASRTTAGQRA
jgi:protease I